MSSFELNADAIAEIGTSDEMTAAMFTAGEDIAEQIKAETPVRDTPLTGSEDDSAPPAVIGESIEVIGNDDGPGVYVVAMDNRYHWIEFGTGGRATQIGQDRGIMPVFGPFRRVAEGSGRFEPA